jgi:hypothetical protein
VPDELAFAHAIAISSDLIGFAVVVPHGENTPERIAADIAAAVSEDCAGSFGSGSVREMHEGVALINAFTACRGDEVGAYLQYVVTPRRGVGQYVIGLFSSDPLDGSATGGSGRKAPIATERLMDAAFQASQ